MADITSPRAARRRHGVIGAAYGLGAIGGAAAAIPPSRSFSRRAWSPSGSCSSAHSCSKVDAFCFRHPKRGRGRGRVSSSSARPARVQRAINGLACLRLNLCDRASPSHGGATRRDWEPPWGGAARRNPISSDRRHVRGLSHEENGIHRSGGPAYHLFRLSADRIEGIYHRGRVHRREDVDGERLANICREDSNFLRYMQM